MNFFFTLLALAIMAVDLVSSAPEGVANLIPRADSAAPEGCVSSYDGPFQASIFDPAKAGSSTIKKRGSCGSDSQLTATLADGVLTDASGRTGYIADNFQFQFDAPPQHGTLVSSGFSVCQNGSLALGGSTVFYQCSSGTFSNLYDRWWAAQCSPVQLQVIACSNIENIPEAPAAKIVGTQLVQTTLVTVLKDGQPQVVPTEVPIPICQIGDGQIQGQTTPCAELPANPTAPSPNQPASPEVPTVATVPSPVETSTPTEPSATEGGTPTTTPTAVTGNANRNSAAVLALVVCIAVAMLV